MCDGVANYLKATSCSSCDNLFCDSCIAKHLQTSTTCPRSECQQEFVKKNISKIVKGMLDKIPFRCPGSECGQNVLYNKTAEHKTENGCLVKESRCVLGCSDTNVYKGKAEHREHLKTCRKSAVVCKICSGRETKDNLDQHDHLPGHIEKIAFSKIWTIKSVFTEIHDRQRDTSN